MVSRKVVTVSADGLVKTIERDSTGGNWFDQREVQTTNGDERTATVWDRNADGSIRSSAVSTTSEDGLSKVSYIDEDGSIDTQISDVTDVDGAGVATRTIETRNEDGKGAG